jgi:hypothetical protein
MSKFKVGDRVYCEAFGKGRVIGINKNSGFPICCIFNDLGKEMFTKEGNYSATFYPDYKLQHATKLLDYLTQIEE